MSPAASLVSAEFPQNPVQKHQAPTPLERGSSIYHRSDVDDPEHVPPFHRLSRDCYDWASFAVNTPSTSEIREAIRTELKRNWYEDREDEFGYNMIRAWNSTWGYMSTLYSGDVPRDNVGPLQLRKFCNKPTALYWAFSAQLNDYCPNLIFGCIYKEWFRCHNGAPNLDFESFFANPVRITSTGPTTIEGILEAHHSFCQLTSSLLDRFRRHGAANANMRAWPDEFKLLPVCWAIIVVLDDLVRDDPKPDDGPRRFISLDNVLQRQSVLIVRTGDESGLSAPISFESVREQALPLARPDIESNHCVDVVRVTLATAVRFVADLQRREEAAIPESAPTSFEQALSPSFDHAKTGQSITNAEEWVDLVMEMADKNGIDSIGPAQDAMSKVRAAQRGEYKPAHAMRLYWGNSWR